MTFLSRLNSHCLVVAEKRHYEAVAVKRHCEASESDSSFPTALH